MRSILLIVCCFLTAYTNGQTFTRVFPIPPTPQKCDMGSCAPIVKTSDGGYILNYSYGFGTLDVASPLYSELVKTDSLFIPIWSKELNGENGKKTFSFGDGSSIIYTKGNGVSIEKIDNAGQTLWSKRYSRTYPYSLMIDDAICHNTTIKLAGCVMKYGGFGSWVYSSALLLSIDTAGDFIQADSLVISSFANTSIYNIASDTAGNCYIMGSGLASQGNSFIAKITSSNTVAWCKNLYFNFNAPGYTSSTVLSNGDLLVGGIYMNNVVGTGAMMLLRFSPSGTLQWSKGIDYRSSVESVQELSDGSILIAGTHSAAQGDTLKNIIIKIDANGNPIWCKRYRAGFSLSSAYQKTNNDWYFTAFTNAPILFNTDSLGVTSCPFSDFSMTFNNLPVTITPLTCSLNPLTISFTATVTNPISSLSYLDTCSFVPTSISEVDISNKLTVYPNPSSGQVSLLSDKVIDEILVTNIFGQVVFHSKLTDSKFTFQLAKCGLYFVAVTSDKKTTIRKLTIAQ